MEAEPKYKLIRSVDPTKINVRINDKFAKLTLSSNKKKDTPESPKSQDLVNRKSASRNLMEQLISADTRQEVSTVLNINPLLRSDSSSKSCSDKFEKLNLNNPGDICHYTEQSDYMEPLQITEHDEENAEQQLETLSQRVSELVVNSPLKNRKCHSQLTICISSSSSDAEDDDDDFEKIIISDTSTSACGPDALDFDCELITSDIPQSGETNDALLPYTFSNERADRIEAFLRDVSAQRKEIECNNEICENSLPELQELLSDDHERKSRRLATADTESMSSYEEEEIQADVEPIKILTQGKRMLTLDETVPMSQSQPSFINQITPLINTNSENNENCEFENSKRLAQDETQANTISPSTTNTKSSNVSYNVHSANNSTVHSPASRLNLTAKDSLVISETSSEADLLHQSTTPRSKQCSPSDELISSKHTSFSGSPIRDQLSQIQLSISAKINIKIQISQQTESDDNVFEESFADGQNGETKSKPPYLPPSEEFSQINVNRSDEQKKSNTLPLHQPTLASPGEPGTDSDSAENFDGKFLSDAEKILTQLYRDEWKTPDVIRTLKRITSNQNEALPTTKPRIKNKCKTPTDDRNRVEESALDDFSIFQCNIVNTNLDSTRLVSPRRQEKVIDSTKKTRTEPRPAKPPLNSRRKEKGKVFKPPQTEIKKQPIKLRRRENDEHWRQLVDNDTDTEGENASDDDEADKTVESSNKPDSNSNHSWSGASGSSSDSDFTIKKKNPSRRRQNTKNTTTTRVKQNKPNSKDDLVYLDLSKNEVTVLEGTPKSPAANNDEHFNNRLQDILRTCRREDKPKLEAIKSTVKTKRKLFNPNYNDEDFERTPEARIATPKRPEVNEKAIDELLSDCENIPAHIIPPSFRVQNKPLDAVKTGKPIFQVTPSKKRETPSRIARKTSSKTNSAERPIDNIYATPNFKYGFLKSLDACVSKNFCHPDVLIYRENYRLKKEELTQILYDLYNQKLFNDELKVPVIWNKKLSNTAGRCLNKKKMGTRSSVIELSEKVLTSADRLRCTLIHELCHAATWVFNGEGGHGNTWKEWARKANYIFPEIPKIGVCHQYDIEYKYTYKCTLCSAKSHAHSKSKKVENIRCSYCHGAIEIFLNKKDKQGNVMPTPVREATGFAKFVKDNYKQYKRPELKHADIMKILSGEFAALKVASNN